MRIANPKVFGLFGRLLAVAVLASMIALPAGQAAAQDTLGISDVVTFTGHTTGLTPVTFTGGSGTYGFASSSCEIVSDVGPDDIPNLGDDPGPTACSFTTASNNYNNIACGTGYAWGTFSLAAEHANPYASGNYSITLIGGQGVVTGTNVTESDSPGSITLTGAITLTPDQPFPSLPFCSTGFTASGEVTLSE